jgi:hypothetical protein
VDNRPAGEDTGDRGEAVTAQHRTADGHEPGADAAVTAQHPTADGRQPAADGAGQPDPAADGAGDQRLPADGARSRRLAAVDNHLAEEDTADRGEPASMDDATLQFPAIRGDE